MSDPREPTVGELLEGAKRGDPVMARMLESLTERLNTERSRLEGVQREFEVKVREIEAEQAQRARTVAAARAQMEADRIVRERATLDAISSIRRLAEHAVTAAEEREERGAAREVRMADLTARLLTLTVALVVLGALTLIAAVVSVIA